jgi:hypothetical protein
MGFIQIVIFLRSNLFVNYGNALVLGCYTILSQL